MLSVIAIISHFFLTGVSALLIYFFGSHLLDHLDAVFSIFITLFFVTSVAILLYLIIRHFTKAKWDELVPQVSDTFGSYLGSIGGTQADIQGSVAQTKELLLGLWPRVRILVAFLAFNTILLELIAVGNAAAIYLQTKRLEDQNILLEAQTEQIDEQSTLLKSQILIAKLQAISDASDFLGESSNMLKNLSNNTVTALEYGSRIADVLISLSNFSWPRYFDRISTNTCSEMPGCTRIDSIDSSTIRNELPLVGSDDELRKLYLSSLSIRDAADELHDAVITHLKVDQSSAIGQAGDLRIALHEPVLVCGLLHDPKLTAHNNRHLFYLTEGMIDVERYANRIIDAWDDDGMSIQNRLDLTGSYLNGLNDAVERMMLVHRASPLPGTGTSTDDAIDTTTSLPERVARVFARGIDDLYALLNDLALQCKGKADSNYMVSDLLVEYAARSYLFVHSLTKGDLPTYSIVTADFLEPLEAIFGSLLDDVGEDSRVMPGGIRVGPFPTASEVAE